MDGGRFDDPLPPDRRSAWRDSLTVRFNRGTQDVRVARLRSCLSEKKTRREGHSAVIMIMSDHWSAGMPLRFLWRRRG